LSDRQLDRVGFNSCSTYYWSFWRRSSQPITWLVQKPRLTNQSLDWHQ